jgi:hypothetical protein
MAAATILDALVNLNALANLRRIIRWFMVALPGRAYTPAAPRHQHKCAKPQNGKPVP